MPDFMTQYERELFINKELAEVTMNTMFYLVKNGNYEEALSLYKEYLNVYPYETNS